ncbi:DUF1015 domain-containing protein [Acidaminobacter hydrogenoformans]|uniref:Uncharacterized conserved protein, DUF1015 family n=1 Tax=Acidaminobacter hydrogenoformans DSM 2784 TaxID=1120920 RepID=A0A1G5S625_9FIRM|nr:DUF1015 family protein [Acidaminobacter hydrogenoformans]SCZ81191.1 Uncharacterized conserved protein, DUF1015 family [Acidaminobacter hydrogenoformans DSM 2784]
MAIVKPFKAIRPAAELVEKVACLPYDVMNTEEAREMAKGNPHSFLHVVRSEIDLAADQDPYADLVYQTARKNLDAFVEKGYMNEEAAPLFYIYRQLMNGRVQTGIVGCTSIDDYLNDIIKKHEFTRPVKEVDRIQNFSFCEAHTEPVFLTYRNRKSLNTIMNDWIKFHMPVYNFTTDDGITHIFWPIDDLNLVSEIEKEFADIDFLYIADGHHRSASSVKVGLKKREENPGYDGSEEFNYFMAVIFPDDDLFIMDYNRVLTDLNGHSEADFLTKVAEKFEVNDAPVGSPYKPMAKHTFGMLLDGKWYVLKAKDGIYDEKDPVDRLDVSILQKNLLEPLLGIQDPRTDKRIDFVGGIRGLEELERRCATDMKIAFSMYPTTMDDLLDIADAGEVMPPKSTWFEPKLRSGLFVHSFK